MKSSLQTRLDRLEAQRAGPTQIIVTWLGDDGQQYTDPACTILAPEHDPAARVFVVTYETDVRTLPDEALEAICNSPAGVQMKALSDDELAAIAGDKYKPA